MGQHVSRTDFEHSYTEEPHASRRKEILKKHPEVKTLFGSDPWIAFWVVVMVAFQIGSLFMVYHLNWVQTIVLAYFLGGTINHSLMLGIHEIAHNLAFGYKYNAANRMLGMIANLPIGVPTSISFRPYHLEHHKFQGIKTIDMDIPSYAEGKLFCTTFGKVIWVFLQPFFYAFRPLFVKPRPLTALEIVNAVVQFTFNAVIIYYFNFRTYMYLLMGTVLAMGMHPVAGHFIAEHYMFNKGQETYSYYGPLNKICFNVGYHNEHHDFPFVPGSRLPQLRAMAPEFYDTLPSHPSWVKVIYDFIMDPSIGPYARIIREQHLAAKDATVDIGSELAATANGDLANGHLAKTANGHLKAAANGHLANGHLKTTANGHLANGHLPATANGHVKKD